MRVTLDRWARLARRGCALALAIAVAAATAAGCDARRIESAQCAFSDQCAAGLVCAGGACRAACRTDRDCASGMQCRVTATLAVCLPPDAPPPCRSAADCALGLRCARDGVCRAECRTAYDCHVRAPYLRGAVCRADSTCGVPEEGPAGRLIAPLPSAVVGRRTVRLEWRNPPGATGARIELCGDNRCTSPMPLGSTVGETEAYVPPTPGLVFWRATWNLSSGAPVGAPSAVWQFVVRQGRGTAGGTTFAPEYDATGDGVADVLVGSPRAGMDQGRVDAFAGADHDVPAMTSSVRPLLGINPLDSIGHGLARVGDLNADGFDEVMVVGGPSYGAVLMLGQPDPTYWIPGPRVSVAATLSSPVVAAAGDVEHSGRLYVIVGDNSSSNRAAYVIGSNLSGALLNETLPIDPPPPAAGARFAASVAGLGDVNADGYDDVAVSADLADMSGAAYVYLGSGAGLVVPPTELRGTGTANVLFGEVVAGAGDVNGDGFTDLAAVEQRTPSSASWHLWLFPGGPGGVSMATRVDVPVPPPANTSVRLGNLAGLGDVNHDGYADLAVSVADVGFGGGRVYVYHGSAAGLGDAPVTTIVPSFERPGTFTGYGGIIAAPGDVNHDGFDDLVTSAPYVDYVFVHLGGPDGIASVPVVQLQNPLGTTPVQFGAALAR